MFNVSRQARTSILLISNDGVSLLCWEHKRLYRQASYTTTEQDLAAFRNYVDNNRSSRFVLIADCIEEDFRNETFAHVTGSDRAALLDRKLLFAFRNSPYRVARVVGREKGGRRDDKVLLSALTKPEMLEPWVTQILAGQAAIQSVTSAVYLMELLAETLKFKAHAHLMLVNLEQGSGLRQTYMQHGKALFSRLTPVSAVAPAELPELLKDQSEQTRKYLERIKLLPYDKPLSVQVFTACTKESVNLDTIQAELLTFQHCNTRDLPGSDAVDMDESEIGALAVALVQVLRKSQLKNVYAALPIRRYFYLQAVSRTLGFTSAGAMLAAAAMATPAIVSAVDNWELADGFVARTQPLLAEHAQLQQRFPETPIPSKTMELVVQTYEGVLAQSWQPVELMDDVSQALTVSPNIRLTEINWRLVETVDVIDELGQTVGRTGVSEPSERPDFQQAIIAGRTMLTTTLRGLVDETASHRAAQDQVLAFIDALGRIPGATVEPLEMPMDVRPETSVSTTLNGGAVAAAFVLDLSLGVEP